MSAAIETLREAARRDGVDREENLPFLLEPAGAANGAAILLVHGFTATPWELRSLGERLVGDGFAVLGVRLPGHGTTPADLSQRHWQEWLATVEEGYALLAARGGRVYGVGVSTGALLLLAAAARQPLAGVVLLAPFLRLSHRFSWAAAMLARWKPFQLREIGPELEPYYYRQQPLRGVAQLRRLVRAVRPLLPQLVLPALVMVGGGDQTIRPESAMELYRLLGSREKEFHQFGTDAPHVLTGTDNPYREEVELLSRRFLARQAGVRSGV